MYKNILDKLKSTINWTLCKSLVNFFENPIKNKEDLY